MSNHSITTGFKKLSTGEPQQANLDDSGNLYVTGAGGGSAPSGTVGAAVPATASPVAVKDNSGNLAYPNLDASGNLLVAVTGAGSGGTSSTDGAAYTAGTTAGTPLMGARDDVATTSLAEGKVGIARLTGERALHVNIRNDAGFEVEPSTAAEQAAQSLYLTDIRTQQTDASQKTRITDGTDNLDITAGGAAKVDGSAVTQPISAVSLPLPTGAAGSGSITALNQAVQVAVPTGGMVAVVVSGTWTGTLQSQASLDGATWLVATSLIDPFSAEEFNFASSIIDTGTGVTQFKSAILNSGFPFWRLKATAWTSGTAVIALQHSPFVTPNFTYIAPAADFLFPVTFVPGSNNVWLNDGAGNAIASATGTPGGSDRGLVVRNLPSGTQAVSAATLPLPTGAATSSLQTQPGVDIGDVTINNASGASAVNVQDGGNSLTIDGSLTTVTTVTTVGTITNVVHVDDNASSLTVDNPVLSIVGGGTEAAAQRVTIANDSTGVLSVDDNGGSLTVDGAVTVTGSVTANAGTNLNTSLLALEAGGNLATLVTATHAEDAASASADVGIAAYGIRQEIPLVDTSATGDYTPFKTDAQGRLWTNSDVNNAKLERVIDLLAQLVREQRIMNEILVTGLSVRDGADAYRNDSSYEPTLLN